MKFIYENGHIILPVDGENYVVDTGAPSSFSLKGSRNISIEGRSYHLLYHTDSKTTDCLKHLLHTPVSGFIGLDILAQGFTVDYNNCEIEFKPTPGKIIFHAPLNGFIVTSEAVINDIPVGKTIIDSGAWISYLNPELIGKSVDTGIPFDDWNPSLGHIHGTIHKAFLGNSRGVKYLAGFDAGKMDPRLYAYGQAVIGLNLVSPSGVVSYDGRTLMEVEKH